MVIDLAKCVGCDACTIACKVENSSPGKIFYAPVLHAEIGKFPKARKVFIPTLCMHCEDPPCMKSCTAKAIIKRPDGIVEVDGERLHREQDLRVGLSLWCDELLWLEEERIYEGVDTPFDRLAREKFKIGTAQKCTFLQPPS